MHAQFFFVVWITLRCDYPNKDAKEPAQFSPLSLSFFLLFFRSGFACNVNGATRLL